MAMMIVVRRIFPPFSTHHSATDPHMTVVQCSYSHTTIHVHVVVLVNSGGFATFFVRYIHVMLRGFATLHWREVSLHWREVSLHRDRQVLGL
jgi:hypothetical protein